MNNVMRTAIRLLLFGVLYMIACIPSFGQDTLRVLSYNVLYLGNTPPCQGPHSTWEGYLEDVVAYANPDIVGLVKAEAIDPYGSAPAGFADSLLQNVFNAAWPGRFAYCVYTDNSAADNISLLFYNQQKLGFANLLCSYSSITDFDTWKLYCKSPRLAVHDTTFLYVTLNHTNSGSSGSDAATRAEQISGEMAQIETLFSRLPNMINMGDFNVHTSTEACYQTLVAPSNSAYTYYDPPFYPDATYSYPADWDDYPGSYVDDLTVSTRTGSLPNTCSNDAGGGKSWYDHIFLSANIINDADHISYLPHSFKVIGNDGNRLGIAENASPPANTSAPSNVVNAVYEMSEHYPIMLTLLVDTFATSVAAVQAQQEKVTVANPVASQLTLMFSAGLAGKAVTVTCLDMLGRVQMSNTLTARAGIVQLPCALTPGVYYLRVASGNDLIAAQVVIKE